VHDDRKLVEDRITRYLGNQNLTLRPTPGTIDA